MAMLDGIRAVFLEALSFVDERSRAPLVKQWKEQCEEVYKYKQALIEEERIKAAVYGKLVAREIFGEINAIKKEYASGDIDGNELYIRLYQLEKKYTEGQK